MSIDSAQLSTSKYDVRMNFFRSFFLSFVFFLRRGCEFHCWSLATYFIFSAEFQTFKDKINEPSLVRMNRKPGTNAKEILNFNEGNLRYLLKIFKFLIHYMECFSFTLLIVGSHCLILGFSLGLESWERPCKIKHSVFTNRLQNGLMSREIAAKKRFY